MKINLKKLEKLIQMKITSEVHVKNLSIYQCGYPACDKARVYIRNGSSVNISSRLAKSFLDVSKNFTLTL